MNLKERSDFYEKIYFYDLDLRDKLEGRLKIPMTLFALLTAMMVYLINEAVVKKSFIPSISFYFLFFTACLSFLISVFYFIKSWYGYKYKLIPNSVVLENYFIDIQNHYKKIEFENHFLDIQKPYTKTDETQPSEWTKEAFQVYLLNSFRDYGSHNTVNNDKKSFNLHRSITFILIAFALLTFSFFPYYQQQLTRGTNNERQTITTTATARKECTWGQTASTTKADPKTNTYFLTNEFRSLTK
tara:strand:- start:2916 stop:3644 length:729 start_codon:yes stop_codon:yes gene_type:complete